MPDSPRVRTLPSHSATHPRSQPFPHRVLASPLPYPVRTGSPKCYLCLTFNDMNALAEVLEAVPRLKQRTTFQTGTLSAAAGAGTSAAARQLAAATSSAAATGGDAAPRGSGTGAPGRQRRRRRGRRRRRRSVGKPHPERADRCGGQAPRSCAGAGAASQEEDKGAAADGE